MKVIEPSPEYGGVAQIRAAMKRTKDAVVYRRLQAILCRMQGQTIAETCCHVQISRDTLHAWVRRWNEGGVTRLAEGKRSGRPRKLPPEVKDLVIKEIEGRLPDGTPYEALWLHGHLKKKDPT
jgi:transposase